MCDLATANRCHAAIEKDLDRLAKRNPGTFLVAYLEADSVSWVILPTFSQAEAFRESLPEEVSQGAILIELPKKNQIYMF